MFAAGKCMPPCANDPNCAMFGARDLSRVIKINIPVEYPVSINDKTLK
jgi:hypothetical protein